MPTEILYSLSDIDEVHWRHPGEKLEERGLGLGTPIYIGILCLLVDGSARMAG
jgi:hypothetical protein